MRFTSTLAAGAVIAGASAQNYLGFNSGATLADRTAKFKDDFKAEFETAAKLNGAPGKFNSVRLYTNIQAYSEEDPIEAFDAAVETETNILLGVWASGTDNIDKEINALKKAIKTHGKKLTDLVIGVTIGSEDLYRISATGIKNKSGVGNSPKAIVGFIDDWRSAFSDSDLADIPVGHADTWDVWGNSTNQPVIDAIDFIAVHEYPYYENDKGNSIDNAGTLFDRAYQTTLDAAGDKPVWVTETGWPYIGPDWDEAEASVKNAKTYWDEVGCRKLFNKTPTFWYTLRDSNPDNEMKFAITDDLDTEPLFDLTCPDTFDTPTSTSSRATASSTRDSEESETSGPTSAVTTAAPSNTPYSDSEDSNNESNETGADNTEGGSETQTQDGSNNPTETPGADSGANSGLKAFSVAAYAVLGLAGAAFTLY
jgi:glucan endo-1,3-beta-D-glucosidase